MHQHSVGVHESITLQSLSEDQRPTVKHLVVVPGALWLCRRLMKDPMRFTCPRSFFYSHRGQRGPTCLLLLVALLYDRA